MVCWEQSRQQSMPEVRGAAQHVAHEATPHLTSSKAAGTSVLKAPPQRGTVRHGPAAMG